MATVVSQSLARRFDPPLTIGSTFETPTPRETDARERWLVAGVVKDAVRVGVRGTPVAVMYEPSPKQSATIALSAVVRVRADAASAVAGITRLAYNRFPGAARVQVRTAADEVATEFRAQFLAALLFSCYAAVALTMAFVSIFGLVSFLAASGAREFAIRSALGAARRHILWTLCRRIVAPTAAGLVLGEGIAMPGMRSVSAQLFGMSPVAARRKHVGILPFVMTTRTSPWRDHERSKLGSVSAVCPTVRVVLTIRPVGGRSLLSWCVSSNGGVGCLSPIKSEHHSHFRDEAEDHRDGHHLSVLGDAHLGAQEAGVADFGRMQPGLHSLVTCHLPVENPVTREVRMRRDRADRARGRLRARRRGASQQRA